MPVTAVSGDTLSKIAAANNITLAQLLAANPDIADPDDIKVGDVINLPGDVTNLKAEPVANLKPGDTETTKTSGGDTTAVGGALTNTAGAGSEPPPGVLEGGETIRVRMGTADPSDDRWYQVYEFPAGSGNYFAYQFNDLEQLKAATGEDSPQYTARSVSWFDKNVLVEAPAEQIIGMEGNFQSLQREVITDAAEAAGIRDPSLIGRIASDPEMQAIMAQAIAGDWTPEQVLAAQRNTTFWKEVLYPGIERFYGQTGDPERAWVTYVGNVEGALVELGYERDTDGTFNSQIKRMLDAGIDDTTFLSLAPTFVRAEQNIEFGRVLSEWARRDLKKHVTFGEWFELVAGEDVPELRAVAERATLAYAAQQQGTDLSIRQIRRISNQSELTEAQARQAFSNVNEAVLALGDIGLEKGNLTRDDIISAAAGIAPTSGKTIDDVKQQVAKVARENELFDDEKLNFYIGFDPQGRPVRPGLQALSPEGA